jgi:hypothetical protein
MTESNNYPQDSNQPVEPQDTPTQVEEFAVSGETLMSKVQELLNESNVRRILIKNQNGQVLLDIPLTAGLIGGAIGVAFFPVIIAVAAIGGMVARLTLVVERRV